MANIKQQKKRVLIAQRQRLENLRYKSTVKTLFRSLQHQVNLSDKEGAEKVHRELVRLLDKAASKKALHPNTASRKKARAARLLISEPIKEAKVVRKSRKKAPARKPKVETTAAATKAAETKAAKAKAAEAAAEVKATTEEAPAEEAATEEAPVEEAPKAEQPKAKAKAKAEETPAEDAPAEDAPAEDTDAKGDDA